MGYTCKKVAEKVGCSDDTVRKVLKAHDIKIRGGSAKKIDQFDMAGNYIQHFWGREEAAQWLVDNGLAKTVNCKRHITDCCNHKITHAYIWKYGILATSGTIKCFDMERYIKELVEIYTSNTLKSKEELESLKKLIMNAHRAGFIAGEESIVNVIDKLTK